MNGASDLLEGRVIGGDFEVLHLLASGGIGAVYEAEQRSTGKRRALKVMHATLLRDGKMRARFMDEARIAGSIESDHVVEVVSAGIDDELRVPWIAMELLRGQTLQAYGSRTGGLSVDDCLEVLSQARHGLQQAHERGLVHRDLKPDNIFVAGARRRGVPFTIKILDFGIAKWVHEVRGGMQNSQAIGTPSWMAPEQLSTGTGITPATDVWALGLLAFWMLTGKQYWVSANDEESSINQILVELVTGTHEAPTLRVARLGSSAVLPEGFDAWFARCIAREPSKRFANAAACVDALERAIADGALPESSAPFDLRFFDEATVEQGARSQGWRERATATPGSPPDADAASPPGPLTAPSGVARSNARGVGTGPRGADDTSLAGHESVHAHGPHDERQAGLRAAVTRALADRGAGSHGAFWGAQAATVLFERGHEAPPALATERLRPSARPLGPDGLATSLWAGGAELHAMRALAELLAFALARHARTSRLEVLPGAVPDRVAEAVRYAALVLGVREPVTVSAISGDEPCYETLSLEPWSVGAPRSLRDEPSTVTLRARAALAVARKGMLGVIGPLASPEQLEQARKAALSLARGAVSQSPYYRPMVSTLGPRRAELERALAEAEPVSSTAWWEAAEETLARAVLLTCADLPSTLAVLSELPLGPRMTRLRETLAELVTGPSFSAYWHRPTR